MRIVGQIKALIIAVSLMAAVLLTAARAQVAPTADVRALLTDRMMTAFKRMADVGAPILGLPAPGPEFVYSLRQSLATHRQDPRIVALLSRAEELYPYLVRSLASLSPQQRATWGRDRRAFLDRSSDKPFVLITDMVAFADTTYNYEHGSGSAQASSLAQRQAGLNTIVGQQMTTNNFMQGQMQNMARSMGNLHDGTWSTQYSGSTR